MTTSSSVLRFVSILAWLPLANCSPAAHEAPPLTSGSAMSVVSVLVDAEALARPHDVELQENLAFVPGKGGSLAIIDIADPESPRLIWHIKTPGDRGSAPYEDAETVLPFGKHLFVGTRDFLSVDLSDPYNPDLKKVISERPRIDLINGMVRRDNQIIAAGKNGWIGVIDVVRPEAPQLSGAYDARERDAFRSPHDLDLAGTRNEFLLVVAPAGFGRSGLPGQVGIYSIADPDTGVFRPVEQWVLVSRVEGFDLCGANRIDVFGNFACVTGSLTGSPANVVILDISNPAQPARTAILPFPGDRGPNGLTVAGSVAFAAGGQTIAAIDLSDPRRPRYLAEIDCIAVFPDAADNAHDLVYRDGFLYVTGQNSNSFGILKVEDSEILRLAEISPGHRRD